MVAGVGLLAGVLQFRETLGQPLVVYACDLDLDAWLSTPLLERYFPLCALLCQSSERTRLIHARSDEEEGLLENGDEGLQDNHEEGGPA